MVHYRSEILLCSLSGHMGPQPQVMLTIKPRMHAC